MNEIMEERMNEANHYQQTMTENEPKVLNPVRSEAGRKAWDTRRAAAKAKAEAMKAVPAPCGISAEQAGWFKTYPQRLAEKREEYAAIEKELLEMEAVWAAAIDGITAK